MSNSVHTCPSCSAMNSSALKESVMLICKKCGAIAYEKMIGTFKPQPAPVPLDWSFIQLNTTGEYDNRVFTIVGRIRLQLRNDYKNFWSLAFSDGTGLWLMESFASFAVFPMVWHTYTNAVANVRAGKDFSARKGLRFTGEYVEKCESISYEGEIGSWKLFAPGFFVVQAANRDNQVGFFTIRREKDDVDFLDGIKVSPESLNLKNILVWDEWK